jgi:hypothetical protein
VLATVFRSSPNVPKLASCECRFPTSQPLAAPSAAQKTQPKMPWTSFEVLGSMAGISERAWHFARNAQRYLIPLSETLTRVSKALVRLAAPRPPEGSLAEMAAGTEKLHFVHFQNSPERLCSREKPFLREASWRRMAPLQKPERFDSLGRFRAEAGIWICGWGSVGLRARGERVVEGVVPLAIDRWDGEMVSMRWEGWGGEVLLMVGR